MRYTFLAVFAMLLMFGLAGQNAVVQAAMGHGSGMGSGPGMGPGTGTGPGHDDETMPGPNPGAGTGQNQRHNWADQSYILDGQPFSHSGRVASVDYHAGGMVMATTDQGDIHLYGLGPAWYWQSHDMDWPGVGDSMAVQGYMVDYNGSPTNIVMSVTLANGRSLQLRDPDTGWPLWMN